MSCLDLQSAEIKKTYTLNKVGFFQCLNNEYGKRFKNRSASASYSYKGISFKHCGPEATDTLVGFSSINESLIPSINQFGQFITDNKSTYVFYFNGNASYTYFLQNNENCTTLIKTNKKYISSVNPIGCAGRSIITTSVNGGITQYSSCGPFENPLEECGCSSTYNSELPISETNNPASMCTTNCFAGPSLASCLNPESCNVCQNSSNEFCGEGCSGCGESSTDKSSDEKVSGEISSTELASFCTSALQKQLKIAAKNEIASCKTYDDELEQYIGGTPNCEPYESRDSCWSIGISDDFTIFQTIVESNQQNEGYGYDKIWAVLPIINKEYFLKTYKRVSGKVFFYIPIEYCTPCASKENFLSQNGVIIKETSFIIDGKESLYNEYVCASRDSLNFVLASEAQQYIGETISACIKVDNIAYI